MAPTGVADPITTTPPRQAGSVRRTTHIDMVPHDGGGLVLAGTARDLRTPGGVAGAADVRARLDARHVVVELDVSPSDARVAALVGLSAGRGFRAAAGDALPDERDAGTPLHLLLDDVPVAALISGYARLYRGDEALQRIDASLVKADVCAGWRADGTMIVGLHTSGRVPVPMGPVANDLVPSDDPDGWHAIPPLPVGAMRRRRMIDLGHDGAVYAMFRDTHVDAGGTETVLHEYSLTATLDLSSGVLSSCLARPHVLPWTECPAAAASAARLDGVPVASLRELVARDFRGTTTCTHLNDLLRSLADLEALTRLLRT